MENPEQNIESRNGLQLDVAEALALEFGSTIERFLKDNIEAFSKLTEERPDLIDKYEEDSFEAVKEAEEYIKQYLH
ncbi:hypothetical protein KW797_04655 [Candidatus Parcubacteria bacterium]|nr:hypothetical protein [Candidatus Parcubacteria bacterium]